MKRRKRKKNHQQRARTAPAVAAAYQPHVEYQETTMQVPFGMGSALTLLSEHELKPVDAILALTLNYRSNWANGRTHWLSRRKLAEMLDISTRYFRHSLSRLRDSLVRVVKAGQQGTIYELTHHLCEDEAQIPRDEHGLPLKFAVARGRGGPFERMFAGDISWKACLVWLVLKRFSDWATGITNPCSMADLARRTRFGKGTICECITELREAGMLERLSKPNEISVFQLYPKPPEKRAMKRLPKVDKPRQMRAEGDKRYSFNGKYRVDVTTNEIEKKDGRRWRPIRDGERHNIPGAIRKAFDQVVIAASVLRARFGIR